MPTQRAHTGTSIDVGTDASEHALTDSGIDPGTNVDTRTLTDTGTDLSMCTTMHISTYMGASTNTDSDIRRSTDTSRTCRCTDASTHAHIYAVADSRTDPVAYDDGDHDGDDEAGGGNGA